MTARDLSRIALGLTLALALVLPGIAAASQSVRVAFATVPSATRSAAHGMPCDGMAMPAPTKAPAGKPSGNCGARGCDLAACLGAGCLPATPHIAASIPATGLVPNWEQPLRPSRLAETLLRPPIA